MSPTSRASRSLLDLAAVIVVVAGLKAASNLLLPVVFAVFLAILASPLVAGLQRLRLPRGLAIGATVLGIVGALVLMVGLLAGSLASFTEQLPRYQARLSGLVVDLQQELNARGIEDVDLASVVQPGQLLQIAGSTLSNLVAAFGNVTIVALTLAFLLLEAPHVPRKLKLALPDPEAVSGLLRFGETLQRYIVIKTIISAATAGGIGLGLVFIRLDFPTLWMLIAFLLNFIPNVGSVLAGVVPVLLALVSLGPGAALATALLYLAVNMVLGNVVEPRVMGDSLGLAPAAVFLSLLFWGWVWGPLGMLLAVPLTVMLKLLAGLREDTRWFAILLGSPQSARTLVGG